MSDLVEVKNAINILTKNGMKKKIFQSYIVAQVSGKY